MKALHVVGSPTSQFFFDLSMLYAQDVVCPEGFTNVFAIAYPDGRWSFGETCDANGAKISLSQLIEAIADVDLVVPHMFCDKGLTTVRLFFEELLKLPLVGSSGQVLYLAQNKNLTKLIAVDAGVRVPKGVRLTRAKGLETTDIHPFPVIVKPNRSDNSDGVGLAHEEKSFQRQCEEAFQFDDEIIIEQYIEGRELRGAILEQQGEFISLPFIEYHVSEDHPIRLKNDKLKFKTDGQLESQSEKTDVPAKCPADLHDELRGEMVKMMITMHKALGCRDFSMYDFRVDKKSGKAYLLEAGLFWSFSPTSMISTMLSAADKDLIETAGDLWTQAIMRG